MAHLVWLITGCTSGSGLALVHAIVKRGDKVIATGRGASTRLSSLSSKDSITVLDLDVTSPPAEIQAIVDHAASVNGRIDVLVNNAGRAGMSTLEEASPDFIKNIFDVNYFGAMKVTQAVLPHMRAAKRGTVAFIGAGLGHVAIPFLTHYSVTKAALTSSFPPTLTLSPLSLLIRKDRSDMLYSVRRGPPKGNTPPWSPFHYL